MVCVGLFQKHTTWDVIQKIVSEETIYTYLPKICEPVSVGGSWIILILNMNLQMAV